MFHNRKKEMFPNLKSEMTRFKVNVDVIANLLGVNPTNIRARLRGDTELTFGEAVKIRDYFNNTFGTAFTIDYLFSSEPITI